MTPVINHIVDSENQINTQPRTEMCRNDLLRDDGH